MLGKGFNIICYRLPIKVDFTRAFNMKAFHNIFKEIFKYIFQIRFCCDYFIIFNKEYFFILESFINKVRLNIFPEILLSVSASRWNSYRNLFLSLEKFNAVRTLSYVCQLIFCAIKFHNWFSKLFIHKHSLITSDIFIF